MKLDLTALKRVRQNWDAASNASVFGKENQPNTQLLVAPCIDHHKLDELFVEGWEPCPFVTNQSHDCIHYIAA